MREADVNTHHNINNDKSFRKRVEFENYVRKMINMLNRLIIYQQKTNFEIGSNTIYNYW